MTATVRCADCGYTCPKFNGWAFCGPCRTPGEPSLYHRFTAAPLALSPQQEAAVLFLNRAGRASDAPLHRASGATDSTMASLTHLGLVSRAPVGARGSVFTLTTAGREIASHVLADRAEDADAQPPRASASSKRPMRPIAVNPKGGAMSTVTTEKNEAPTAEKPKPDVSQELFEALVAKAKEIAGENAVVQEKAVYTRVSTLGKALVYINNPGRKGVRVEVPQPDGSGYDVVKVAKRGDLRPVESLLKKRAHLLAQKAAAKETPAAEPQA